MNLYIRIRNGLPFEHPIVEENFIQAFPDVDLKNLPPEFAKFERIPAPDLGPYEVNVGVTYEQVDNIVKDVWNIRPMTDEEKLQKQESVKVNWNEYGFPSWQFNEVTCKFDPPVPKPQDGNLYIWDENTLSWKLIEN